MGISFTTEPATIRHGVRRPHIECSHAEKVASSLVLHPPLISRERPLLRHACRPGGFARQPQRLAARMLLQLELLSSLHGAAAVAGLVLCALYRPLEAPVHLLAA